MGQGTDSVHMLKSRLAGMYDDIRDWKPVGKFANRSFISGLNFFNEAKIVSQAYGLIHWVTCALDIYVLKKKIADLSYVWARKHVLHITLVSLTNSIVAG